MLEMLFDSEHGRFAGGQVGCEITGLTYFISLKVLGFEGG